MKLKSTLLTELQLGPIQPSDTEHFGMEQEVCYISQTQHPQDSIFLAGCIGH
jgi:hypothetical protein